MAKPARPDLVFHNFDQMLADIDRLKHGYVQKGAWTLAMIMDHLAKNMSGANMKPMPWPLNVGARAAIHWVAQRPRYPQFKFPAPPKMRPDAAVTTQQADAALRHVVNALKSAPGPTISPTPFGPVPIEDFRKLHLLHAAHHLSFLQPFE